MGTRKMMMALVVVALAVEPARVLAGPALDLELPRSRQQGEVSNCGPTAAAMLLGAYQQLESRDAVDRLRDRLGQWSWDAFPLRQVALPGYDAGMTTPGMLRASLEKFGRSVRFEPLAHAWIPLEAWSLLSLEAHLRARRPMIVLTQSATLWGIRSPGLHWVVVRGLEAGRVVYNDPGDGTRSTIPLEQFWRAWRLNEVFRRLPLVGSFAALVPDRPLPVPGALATTRVTRPERSAPEP